MDPSDLIARAYEAFNARDIDAALSVMTPDVDWPNAWEGGRAVGHEAVRDYWTRQWKEINPRVEAEVVEPLPDGRIRVTVHQVVHSPEGELLVDGHVFHIYSLADGLISRMDVVEATPDV
jgi:hypothetical protein